MGYQNVVEMPVQRFRNYIKWKSDLEEEKQKMYEEHANSMK